MSKVCSICQRSPRTAHSRSHSNIATKRRMMLNLQRRVVNGIRRIVCTSCMRTLRKNQSPA